MLQKQNHLQRNLIPWFVYFMLVQRFKVQEVFQGPASELFSCMCPLLYVWLHLLLIRLQSIRFHLMFRAFLFIYMETQDIFRQCHHLTICFLTSDLTNSTRFTIRNKNQRTLIVRRAGLSRHFDGWKCCVWNYANLWQNTKKITLFDFCLANLFGIFVGIGKWILLAPSGALVVIMV